MFYVYCFLSTYFLTSYCMVFKNDITFKLTLIALYSLICTLLFYFINIAWKYYKKNMIFILLLIILPIIYIINIKFTEKIGKCENMYMKVFSRTGLN